MSVTQTAETLVVEAAALAATALFSPVVIGTAGLVAATTIMAPAANAQNQTTFKVGDAVCTVTEYLAPASLPRRLATSHMVSISGPLGMAMVRVSDLDKNKNEITVYISPSGGIVPDGTPQGKDYRPVINQVWKAYLDQKNQAAPANTASANEPSDPIAAAQANAAAIAASNVTPTIASPPSVKFPAGGGAIVTKGSRTITLTLDGADATIVDQSVTGQSRTEKATYEGDGTDNDYKQDGGKILKGLGRALIFSGNGHMENRIQATKDRWKLTDASGHTITSTGGYNASIQLHETQKSVGDQALRDVLEAENTAKNEAVTRKAAGETVQFDTDGSSRGQHAYKALATYVGKLTQ
ncbi:MAG: hypothetical protein ABSE86_18800 [Bryobacteraceae bacterium]